MHNKSPKFKRSLTMSCTLALAAILTAMPARSQEYEFNGNVKFFPAERNGVPETYIVLLEIADPGPPTLASGLTVQETAQQLAVQYGAEVLQVWTALGFGFVATMDEEQARSLSEDTAVAKVIQDTYYSTADALSTPVEHCYTHLVLCPRNRRN